MSNEATNLTGMYNRLRRNTESEFYKDLVTLLEFRLDVLKNELLEAGSVEEYKRIQGRAIEIRDMLSHLNRRKAKPQKHGSYGS